MQHSPPTQKERGKTAASLLHPAKLPNYLVGVIIFFSATQLGYHFWPESALVYGLRVNYLSPTLYVLDLLIIFYLFLQKKQLVTAIAKSPLMTISLPIIMTNLIFSTNPLTTLSWSLHALLYVLFFSTIPPATMWRVISFVLPIAITFQVVLAAVQAWLGHSLGGFMWYLGESVVSVGSPGVAVGSLMDEVVLRAYGTFGHPNVLAGWLVVSLLIPLHTKLHKNLTAAATILVSIGVLLAQSVSASLTLFGIVIPLYVIKQVKTRLAYYALFIGALLIFFQQTTPPLTNNLSVTERLDLQQLSIKAISHYPFFGTGAQASIATYPSIDPNHRLLQPDHNSLTLFISWFGIFGTIAILYSLRSRFFTYSLFLIPLLPLVLLDHYFLTSPQGLSILVLYATLCVCSKRLPATPSPN